MAGWDEPEPETFDPMPDELGPNAAAQDRERDQEEAAPDQAVIDPRAGLGDFDPAQHVRKLSTGGWYMDVKWRLIWLRRKHPAAVIETRQMSERITDLALFHTTITLPDGQGQADGWGSETPGDFRDYIEKAETKAIGRALAHLGFGTFDAEPEPDGRIVDAPNRGQQDRHTGSNAEQARRQAAARDLDQRQGGAAGPKMASQNQTNYIGRMAKDLQIPEKKFLDQLQKDYGVEETSLLTSQQASELIKRLRARLGIADD